MLTNDKPQALEILNRGGEVNVKRRQIDDYSDENLNAEPAPRATSYRPAVVTLEYGAKIPVVIKDISLTGVRIEYVQRRKFTERVRITETGRGLCRWAEVVWQRDSASGLRFLPN